MLLRKLTVNCCQYFSRTLIVNSYKLSRPYIKRVRSQHLLLLASAVTYCSCTIHHFQSAILCEEKKNMTEIEQSDSLYNANKFKELHEYMLQFKDSEDPELLWRTARAHRDRASMDEVSADEKKKLKFDGLELAKRAMEFGDDNFACHKWYGIMLSQTGDYLGTKKKIEDSPLMKKHFEKAIELCPTDSTSYYLIGMWCFSFADLAWYERKIASVVFGTPPTSSYEEALKNFEKAESLDPSFYSDNQYMIGLVYLRMGKKAEAKEWFEKVVTYNVIKDEDKEIIKKAQDELKKL